MKNVAKHVRFYFRLSVSHLIPANPHGKKDKILDEEWENEFLKNLQNDVEAKLSEKGFDAAYRKHTALNPDLRLYAVDFVVSALRPFTPVQILARGKNSFNFNVKKKPLENAKALLKGAISGALKSDYVINEISYEYAASRIFFFEEYLAGTLHIKHEITDDGLGVRAAIESFNQEVSDFLSLHRWNAEPKTTNQRTKDNVYEFELNSTQYIGYEENRVCGPLVLLKEGANASDASGLGIDYIDEDGETANRDEELKQILECDFPFHVKDFSACWVDYDGDVWDINDLF